MRTIRNTRIQSVPHRKHNVSATDPNRLMLFGETVAVYCENHTERTDGVCTWQTAAFTNVVNTFTTAVKGYYSYIVQFVSKLNWPTCWTLNFLHYRWKIMSPWRDPDLLVCTSWAIWMLIMPLPEMEKSTCGFSINFFLKCAKQNGVFIALSVALCNGVFSQFWSVGFNVCHWSSQFVAPSLTGEYSVILSSPSLPA
jgi:hypothetical protein